MINVEKFADKLNHHDLIVIEEALLVARKTYCAKYHQIREDLLDSPMLCDVQESERDMIMDRMKTCCHYFDTMLEFERVLSVYHDVRADDYKNKDF